MIIKRCQVLGYPVDAVDFREALRFIENRVDASASAGTVLAVNPEKIIALKKSPFLATFFRKSALLIPDGIGVVAALRIKGERVQRVPGADLMQSTCCLAATRGYRIFLYGGKEEVSLKASEELAARYPGLLIAGRRNGYVAPEEQGDLVKQINASRAQILFVALGSPRQEEWMSKYMDQLHSISIIQGIGGTLDTIAGTVRRAPILWQKLHLEWFFRLIKQPSRAPRQFGLVRFAMEVVIEEIRRRFSGVRT